MYIESLDDIDLLEEMDVRCKGTLIMEGPEEEEDLDEENWDVEE